MDKIREQYKVHREEEEIKKQLYHTPHTARRYPLHSFYAL